MILLVPSDPLRPRRPDEHFAAEAAVARDLGITVALLDHDALPTDPARAVARVPEGEDVVYRGWMVRAGHYADLARALARRGAALRTDPLRYRRAHELPGWHDHLAPLTPRSAWTAGYDRTDFDRARAELGSGPAVLRDYTKSLKHHWDEAAFIPDVADGDAAWRVALRFRELRGADCVGGFVLREFERWRRGEVRTWWVDGECALLGPHPDTPDELPGTPDLTALTPLVCAADLRFATVDLVLAEDGGWRVVELGDGQVSDRPAAITPEQLIGALHRVG
ncbi:ATP-grasp domain-containing protein [Actinosynnema pretiosum]|uniref:ATP-grasp domain-containing protein n=1 Tax=Actinosynnema pretiosum TaxID=42197 RepID=A0A290Z4X8_9PSEU|nr:ATP-grasp domain-containing protein [Actinosynnema pretiosum]ATE54076.1 hypothetical protein CNX65_12875 [Actinosynnema pretiosum]